MATIESSLPVAATIDASPPKYSAEGRRLFSVDEYAQLGAHGILRRDERTELIGGEVRRMNAMGPRHAVLVRRLTAFFIAQFPKQFIVSAQCPLQLDNFTEPEPDLALLRWRSDEYTESHPKSDDVLLLIEISDSTLRFDRKEKMPRYAAARIPEVWIVDIQQQQIEQYSQPNQGVYEKQDVRKIDDEIRSLGSPTITLKVKQLFV